MSDLGRDMLAVLFFKLCAILLLWELFFGPAHTVVVTPSKVDAALFGAPPAPPPAKPRS
ncbi:MAG: cytochrome oxidase putative small subunit CydP [Bacillota bacterium]